MEKTEIKVSLKAERAAFREGRTKARVNSFKVRRGKRGGDIFEFVREFIMQIAKLSGEINGQSM